MSYVQYGLIEASEFNGYVGNNPSTTSGKLNTVWAIGGTNAGYGQIALSTVAVGNLVTANHWASLINTTSDVATHQGTSITSVVVPTVGANITYLGAVPTNLTTVYNSRLNAASQGSTVSNSVTYGSTWSAALTFEHTVTFANGDAARYFFNSGGQLAITCSHPSGTGVNLLFSGLASNVGTIVLSSPISGTITIAGTSYNGITKIGGGGSSPVINPNAGYYSLTASNSNVFSQTASTGPSYYLSTLIKVIAKTNGTQGTNGDAGNIITIYTMWDEVPDGTLVSAGSTTALTVRPPEVTAQFANTWGNISVSGIVSGS